MQLTSPLGAGHGGSAGRMSFYLAAHLHDAAGHQRAQALRAAHAADLMALETLYVPAEERTSCSSLIASALIGAAMAGDLDALAEWGLDVAQDVAGPVSDAELAAALSIAIA